MDNDHIEFAIIALLEQRAAAALTAKRPEGWTEAEWNARQTGISSALHSAVMAIEYGDHVWDRT